jgi:hypothetical protein
MGADSLSTADVTRKTDEFSPDGKEQPGLFVLPGLYGGIPCND